MTTANYHPDCLKHLFLGVMGAICLFLLLLISSCQQKKEDPVGYSEAFKPIFSKVTLLYGTNRVQEGLRYLDSSVNLIRPGINDQFRVYGFHYVYWKKVNVNNQKALLYADSMLALANKSVTQIQYVSNYVEANLAIGDAYFDMQQFNDAYQHYFKGYTVGRNNLNNRALSDYAYRMGMIMYKMGHYKLAANYFKDSFKFSAKTDDEFSDFYRIQEVIDNIGLSYKHNNQPDSAILYFNKALNYINQNEQHFKSRFNMIEMATGVVYGNMAEALIVKGDYNEAVELLKKSIAINLKKGNDNSDAAFAEIKLAQIYYDRGESNNLFNLLSALKTQLSTIKNANAEADWNRLMSNYYLRKKDLQKSLSYLQAYNTIKDSNINRINLLKASNVNVQLDNYEKQYQIDRLQNHSKLQQVYLYILIVGAIVAIIIILLIYRNWKLSSRDVQIVNALNKQISTQKSDLEKTLEELKSSSLEKDRILRTVAHDLRNPIGGISSLTKAMADDGYTKEQMELINLIQETSNNSLELINEILEITGSGLVKLNKELVDINSLLSKSVDLLRFKAAEKDQEIKLELFNTPEELLISREKIWRVIGNLISNASKFSPAGSIIYVKIADYDTEIEISVKDAGIGIPENLKNKVFNMFTEAKRIGTAGEKSFGLGLSISKQIIECHDGKIWFENNSDIGTTFYIRLPKPPVNETMPSENQHTNVQIV